MRILRKNIIPIFLLIWIFSLTLYSVPSLIVNKDNPNENFFLNQYPKMSAQEINITTPENKTYTSRMTGYYPATYGFENEQAGNVPAGWYDTSGAGCKIEVYEDLDGRKKVLELYDAGDGGYVAKQNFTMQYTGSVELWVRKSSENVSGNSNAGLYVLLRGGSGTSTDDIGPYIRIDRMNNGKFDYSDGTFKDIAPYTDNKWYHLRIDFNVTSDIFDLYINGDLELSNALFYNGNNLNNITWVSFIGNGGGLYGKSYVDAVAYSWDNSYNISQNRFAGLFLNFKNNTNLDWIGYSLDKQSNRTIIGNKTIPMPSNGLHTIQVFANNSVGTHFQSDLRYFTVNITASKNPPDTPDDFIIIIIITIIISSTVALSVIVIIYLKKKRADLR
jgi:hypothetical protein